MKEISELGKEQLKFPCKICGRHIEEHDPCVEVHFWISGWDGEDENRENDFICIECYNKTIVNYRQDIKIRNFEK